VHCTIHRQDRGVFTARRFAKYDELPENAQVGRSTNPKEFAMLTSIRGLLAAFVLPAAAFAAAPALADDAAAKPLTVTGSVTLVTDYRFRGVSLSGGDPAIQGGITVTHKSGLYVGTWSSSIDDGGTDFYGDQELDLFGGWSGNVAEGVGLDAGLLYYAYPSNAKGVKAEFFEPYATLSGTIGPVQAKLGVNYAWDQAAIGSQDNLYVHSELSAGIPRTPLTLSAHLGYNSGPLSPDYTLGLSSDKTAWDWSIGASATVLGHLTLGVSYVGVEANAIKAAGLSDNFTNNTVVGSLGLSF
jgi:uncharacterized protein (TIGR02001 family)